MLLNYIPNSVIPSIAPIPTNIFFLTCDAFGVLPPVSLLTTGQAKYYFINGYSAKIPGSEIGVEKPTAIFSTCYGGPFLPLPAVKYCEMLGEKLVDNNIKVWLINTGWIGGGYGVGERIKLEYSRLIIDAILQNKLNNIPFDSNNIFSLAIPTSCGDLPPEILYSSKLWSDEDGYIKNAKVLVSKFYDNFTQFRPHAEIDLLSAELRP